MSVDHDRLVKQKLLAMTDYLEEIAPYLEKPLEEHLQLPGHRRIVERLAQIIVESAIDASALLIDQAGKTPPPTAYRSFEVVHELGVINSHLLDRFRRYIGFRNRIVHNYDILDSKIVYYTAKRLVDDAKKYMEMVYAYISG